VGPTGFNAFRFVAIRNVRSYAVKQRRSNSDIAFGCPLIANIGKMGDASGYGVKNNNATFDRAAWMAAPRIKNMSVRSGDFYFGTHFIPPEY
jgi:hypothetical protein